MNKYVDIKGWDQASEKKKTDEGRKEVQMKEQRDEVKTPVS